ncbi:MAG TPA: Hsp20/alpha crystallin family protein [Vicinamibacterales bacterium]|nr:Hsp20/alpha crystallin family protein [Vicinamibacterales bacterium]
MGPNPWRDLRGWQDRLERLSGHHPDSWAPPIDVYETSERYVIAAELPGLTREQIELAMEDSRLTIRGERVEARPSGEAHYHQVERGHGAFSRTFEFADKIDVERVTADLTDGVLTVTLPKLAPPAARKITVS